MSFLRFLAGLATKNPGTKFMALLLALVLYVFVDQQGQESRVIGELTLRFVLDETNAREYMLLADQIALTDIRIKGQRERVTPLARELNQAKLRTVILTPRMLQVVRDGFRIPLSATLLREAAILPPEIEIDGELPSAAVEFAEVRRRTMTLRIQPGQEERLRVTGEDLDFVPERGDLVDPKIARDELEVEVVGPEHAFRNDSQELLVVVPEFEAVFRNLREPEPTMRVPVAGIDWPASGLQDGLIEHVRIDRTAARAFAKKLELSFGVRPDPVEEEIEVEILFVGELPGGLKLQDYSYEGSPGGKALLLDSHIERRRGPVVVERPRTVLENDMKKLKLLVDLGRAEVEDNKASLLVPASLWTSPPDLNLLSQVRLVLKGPGPFELQFSKQ